MAVKMGWLVPSSAGLLPGQGPILRAVRENVKRMIGRECFSSFHIRLRYSHLIRRTARRDGPCRSDGKFLGGGKPGMSESSGFLSRSWS